LVRHRYYFKIACKILRRAFIRFIRITAVILTSKATLEKQVKDTFFADWLAFDTEFLFRKLMAASKKTANFVSNG